MTTRELILNTIINKNGKLIHFACKKEWFIERKLTHIYELILSETDFLPCDVSLRERMFYIENDLRVISLCPLCNVRPLKFQKNYACFSKHCGDAKCKSAFTTNMLIDRWKNMEPEKRSLLIGKISSVGKKSGESNKGKSLVEIHGRQKAEIIISKISNASINSSDATKQKRVTTRKSNGIDWHSPEAKNKIKQTNTRVWKEFNIYEKYKEKYQIAAKENSIRMKNKILTDEFTPCITNSWTGLSIQVEDSDGNVRKFRSSWEAGFWLSNKNLQYEKIRIPYIDENGKNKIYITDFLDEENKIIYEVKPDSKKTNNRNKIKYEAATNWCNLNGYRFEYISDDWFVRNSNIINFGKNDHIKKKILKIK